MKRLFAAVLIAALMVSLAGCGSGKVDDMGNWDYKTGLAVYTRAGDSYSSSATTGDKVTSTIVAAVFDKDGKIIKINIDEVELRPGAAGETVSKKEMGDDYGMKAVSGIGKEWYQQVNDLEKWLTGKNISRLTSTAAGKMRQYTGANSQPAAAADGYTARNSDGTAGGTMTDGTMANSGKANSAANSGVTASSGTNSGTIGGVVGDVMDGVNSAIDDMTDGGMNNAGTTAGMWAGEDLRSMVTIDTTNIRAAVEKAWRNAK